MGQAKLRGTFEQRKAAGEARKAEELRLQKEAAAQREASMTPEQRAKRRKIRMILAWAMGMSANRTELTGTP